MNYWDYLNEKLKIKNEVLSELTEEHIALKKSWGKLNDVWVSSDIRDQVVNLMDYWAKWVESPMIQFLR